MMSGIATDCNYRMVETCATCISKDFWKDEPGKWIMVCSLNSGHISDRESWFVTDDWHTCNIYQLPNKDEIIIPKRDCTASVSYGEAKKKITAYLKEHPEEIYPDVLARKLNIDFQLTMKVLKDMEYNWEIEVVGN